MQIDLSKRPPGRLMVDTSVLIAHLRGNASGEALMQWAGAAGPPYVSSLSVLEVAQGMLPHEEDVTQALLASLQSVDVVQPIPWEAGVLLRDLRKRGLTIHLPDAVIAVSARAVNVPVLTHNVRHFDSVPDLEVLDAGSVAAVHG